MSTSMIPVDMAWLAASFPGLSGWIRFPDGGQKVVFAATHPTDGKVVLKLIKPGQDPERTRREIRAVRQIASNRVPVIFDAGTVGAPSGDLIWIREQFVDGRTLRSIVSAGPQDRDVVLRLAGQLLEVCVQGEAAQLVHRDIKPENIIRDPAGDFWLLDFGIARHLDLISLTASGQAWGCGTPGYGSPEQFRNRKRDIDVRADLFGLGVVLFEMSVGQNPLTAGARDALECIHRTEMMPLPLLRLGWDPVGAFGDFLCGLTRPFHGHRPRTAAAAMTWFQDVLRNC